jgi:hypothetical protein
MNTNTNTFQADVAISTKALEALNLKGTRPAAVRAFLAGQEGQSEVTPVDGLSAGTVRRGLRQLARRFDHQGDVETAEVFWALRDDVEDSVEDGVVFTAA